MDSSVKVSIIIPTYNAEHRIARCLRSLQTQTLKDIEVICIDDCSSDGTWDFLCQKSVEDSRIRVLRNEVNKGTFYSRKRGVAEASGQYIMFADNDDWYEANACKELYDATVKADVDILMYEANAVSDKEIETKDEKFLKRNWEKKLKVKDEEIRDNECLEINNQMTWLWNRIIRADVCKKAFENSQDERLTFVEDAYGCWLVHFFARSFSTVHGAYYNYDFLSGTSSQQQYSSEEFRNKCMELKTLENLLEKLFTDNNVLEKNRWVLEYEHDRGLDICCSFWRDRVREEDLDSEFDFLCQEYGKSSVLKKIRNNFNAEYSNKNKFIIQNDALKEKINNLNNSTSMKLGKAITALPRKMKK